MKTARFFIAGLIGFHLPSFAQQPLAGHLSFPTENAHAHLYWEKGPVTNEESVLRIEFANAANHTPTAITSTLTVEPRMQMGNHDHGTSPVTIEKIKDTDGNELIGQYRISRIFFVMSGKWKVKFTLTHADQTTELQAWDVTVPSQK